jgi:hypothetical protein
VILSNFIIFIAWNITQNLTYNTYQSPMNLHLPVNKTEDVVEDEVASSTVRQKLESLSVVHWLLLLVDLGKSLATAQPQNVEPRCTYKKSTGNHDKNTALLVGRLGIESADLMRNLLEGKRL